MSSCCAQNSSSASGSTFSRQKVTRSSFSRFEPPGTSWASHRFLRLWTVSLESLNSMGRSLCMFPSLGGIGCER